MKPIKILSLLLVLLLASCRQSGGSEDTSASVFDSDIYTPAYASGFDIRGAEGRKSSVINIRNPWQGADSIVSSLFLARGGERTPEGFSGQVLEGDARRIVCMSSTHIAMLDAIGADSLIAGVSGIGFITNPKIRNHRDSIGDVGYEGNINFERLLALDPDIVLLYGVNGASSMEGKLRELGIPFMYVGDYLEESPLGKAEWMVALAELTGNRATGEKTFAGISDRYEALRRKVAESVTETPTVMLNVPYGDSWFMPPTGSYMVSLIRDAGGDYIYRKNTGNESVPIDLEEAYLLTSQADFWLNVDKVNSLDELRATCPKFTDTRCFRDGNVFNNTRRANASGGNDFYESAVVNPDILLRDLIGILHPGLSDSEPVYYKQLK